MYIKLNTPNIKKMITIKIYKRGQRSQQKIKLNMYSTFFRKYIIPIDQYLPITMNCLNKTYPSTFHTTTSTTTCA